MVHQILDIHKARKVIATVLLGLLMAIGASFVQPQEAYACAQRGCEPPSGGQGEFKGGAVFIVGGGKTQVVDNPGRDPVCEGCEWKTVASCGNDGKEPCVGDALCDAVGKDDGIWIYVFFSKPPDVVMKNTGKYCKGEQQEVVGVEDIAQRLRRDWVKKMPDLKPVSQPKGGKTLVGNGFVTIFDSGQPKQVGPITVQRIYGVETRLEATGRWHWDFGDGHKKSFDIPGSTYPDKTVGHIYEKTGKVTASVRTEWHGRFWFGGHGPWEIQEPAVQGLQTLDLEVVESLPVLGGKDGR